MPAIIALALVVFIGIAVLGFAVHLLFSPWLLVAAVVVFAWIRLRPHGSPR
jgi:hypothetical protein